jgi:preprotein translocase subunit SecG
MSIFVTVLHVLVCVILIVVVLLQRGKGAEIGAVFGGGASSTVFGSRGAGNFFTKLTTGAAIVFMVTSLVLSYLNTRTGDSLLDDIDEPAAEESAPAPEQAPGGFTEVPAAPAAPAPAPDAPAP